MILGNLLRKLNFWSLLNHSIPISSERNKVIILIGKRRKKGMEKEGRMTGGRGGKRGGGEGGRGV